MNGIEDHVANPLPFRNDRSGDRHHLPNCLIREGQNHIDDDVLKDLKSARVLMTDTRDDLWKCR